MGMEGIAVLLSLWLRSGRGHRVQAVRVGDAFQLVQAVVGELGDGRGPGQAADGLGNEGLARSGLRADAGGDVDSSAIDVGCGPNHVAGVEADVKPKSHAAGTIVSTGRAL